MTGLLGALVAASIASALFLIAVVIGGARGAK